MITLLPPEWREARLAEHRAELDTIRAAIDEHQPRERKNGALAQKLTTRLDVLTFRGVEYDVPFLPYHVGFELTTLYARLFALSQSSDDRERQNALRRATGDALVPSDVETELREMLGIMKRAVALFWENVRAKEPARGWLAQRLHDINVAWAFARARHPQLFANPFATASQAEVSELFAFFFACRTRSSVRRHLQGEGQPTFNDPSIMRTI